MPELWIRAVKTRPLSTKMDRKDNSGRRQARAKALQRHYGKKHAVFYVDVAGSDCEGWHTAVVIQEEKQVDGLTFKAPCTTQAEEVAITLAAFHHRFQCISDSRGACRNYEAGWITPLAERISQNYSNRGIDPIPLVA